MTPAADAPAPLSHRWMVVLSVLGVLSVVLLCHAVWIRTVHVTQLDFAVYALGSHHLVDGTLYSTSLPIPPHLPFTYPPIAALVFVPLGLMPAQAGQVVWALVNMVSLYAIVALSLRAVRPGIDRTRLLLVSLVLVGPATLLEPVWLTFYFGQVNLVLCALILADLTLTIRVGSHRLPRGVLLGVTAAVKLIPLVFVPYLFVTRQVRAAWVSVVAFAGATLVAAAVNPSVTWSYFTRYATDARRVGQPFFISNQSLRGSVDRLDHGVVSVALVTAASAVVLVAGIALARWAYRDSSPFLGILVCATTGMLVSPITWEHHLVWVVPILMWLACAPDRPAGGPVWAAAAAGILVWAPVLHVPSGGDNELHEHGWQLVAGNSFFGLLVGFLVGVTVLLAVRRRRRDAPGGLSAAPSPAPSTAATT